MDYDWLGDVAALQTLGSRKRQEDSALHVRLGRGRLIVVADGMGGEPAGDIASMAAVLGFERGFGTPADGHEPNIVWVRRFTDGLTGALDAINAAAESGHGQDGMAATLSALWVDSDGVRWLNVGDSGIWTLPAINGIGPGRLTESHSQGWGVQSGLLAGHGHGARTQADLARYCVSQIDIQPGPRETPSGAIVLAASDGFDVLVDSRRRYGGPPESREEARVWEEVYRHKNPARFLEGVEGVLAESARDNTTVIAIRTSVDRTYTRFEDYEPVSGAPDREVLGPELPEGLVL